MTFKFGLLVLLLFLENTVAEERQPRVPTVDLVTALEYVPHLRRDMLLAKQSPVKGLLSNSFRRSLQSTRTTCAWDGKHGKCLPSNSTMKSLLKKSNTEFAKMIFERVTCIEKKTYRSCMKNKACLWDIVLDQCIYMDTRRHHEDSPCAKAAPRHFDVEEASIQCFKIVSVKRCEKQSQCRVSWFGLCTIDTGFIIYGIKNFLDKSEQIGDSVQAALKAEYAALQSADNFTWQSLLDYKPKVECPPDTEQLVCEYAVAYWSSILAPQFYCPGKYESADSDCKADALCRWNPNAAECTSEEYLARIDADRSSSKIPIDALQDGIDKKILEAQHKCRFLWPEEMCTGICYWNPQRNKCRPRRDYVASLLTEAGKNSTDALCTYTKVNGFSDCWTRFSERKCERSKFCRVNSIHRCEPSEELFLSAVADEDPRLKRKYQRFKKGCARHTSETACVESTEVH